MFHLVKLASDEAAPYVPPVNLPEGNPTPTSTTGVTTRVARSTRVSQAVKQLYGGACQVCKETLRVPGGTLAEGAHIVALGGTHAGPDVPENVLCLCPNHHSLFDAGGLYVDDALIVRDFAGTTVATLAVHPAHTISQEHLQAHRRRFRFESDG
ncbi:HNH endonuclease [Blastococcus sp. SYSU DS0619]